MTDNADDVARWLESLPGKYKREAERIVREDTLLLVTKVKANASGRPGPRVITGDYRRSITEAFVQRGDVLMGSAGTNAPQGPRLEYGFVGRDRAGRYYNQPPFPHFRPAMEAMRPIFTGHLEAMLARGGR